MADVQRYGKWEVMREIGRGGQGRVYLARDTSHRQPADEARLQVRRAITKLSAIAVDSDVMIHADDLAQGLAALLPEPTPALGALKVLLPLDEAVNAETAAARMKMELEALASTAHPSLIRILDSQLEERWFVMEYFKSESLSKQLGHYKGRVLDALVAFRPVVDATRALHGADIVHRDIKPANIFIADDGHLVLGDCGLAIKLDIEDRLTDTYENVGTRDYQPPWTYGLRVEEVKPNFDVFSLAKLLWAMISGRPRFPLEDFDIEPNDLRSMFPANPDVLFVHRILKKCVVRREAQCAIPDAAALLDEVDRSIRALSGGAVVPTTKGKMRCRFCGLGFYQKADEFAVSGNSKSGSPRRYYCCDHCGHLEFFVSLGRQTPLAWKDIE